MAYGNLNQHGKALKFFIQALPINRLIGDRQSEATTLTNIGGTFSSLGQPATALGFYNQALTIFRAVRDRQAEATTLGNIQLAYQAQKQPKLAILYGKQSVNIRQSIRRDIAGLSKASRDAYLQDNKSTYETLAALLIEQGRLTEAEQVSRMLKQGETFDFVRRDATQSGESEALTLSPLERDYIARYDKLGTEAATVGDRIEAIENVSETARTKEQSALLETLYTQREAIDGRFEVFRKELVAAFGKVTPDLQTVDVAASDAWQKALGKVSEQTGKKTALMTTVVAPDRFYVLVTTPTARLHFSAPIKSGDLNALVNRFRTALTNPKIDPQDEAKALWKIVFCGGELETALEAANVQVALWSLSGSLRYVPLDALHDGSAYLVARPRLNIVMTTTSKDFFEAPVGGKALAVGTSHAFDVEVKDPNGAPEKMSFAALTQVPGEVRGIIHDDADGGTGPLDGQILLDSDFNALGLQAQLRRGVRTVHVATHFRLRPGDSQQSFLLLGDGNALPVFDWKVKMPLKNVELLTLSACETGLGGDAPQDNVKAEETGAEVGSLGEVAQLQGASAVVVSLWSVDDNSTSLLMRDFYTRWRADPTDGKGEALRQAQRALLGSELVTTAPGPVRGPRREDDGKGPQFFEPDPKHPFAHPYFWAPFTMIGNWR